MARRTARIFSASTSLPPLLLLRPLLLLKLLLLLLRVLWLRLLPLLLLKLLLLLLLLLRMLWLRLLLLVVAPPLPGADQHSRQQLVVAVALLLLLPEADPLG